MKLAQQGVFMKGAAHLPCAGCWGGRAGADWSCWCSDSSGFLWTLMNLRKGEDRWSVNEGECSLQVWTDLTELIFLMILWLKLVLQASWYYI